MRDSTVKSLALLLSLLFVGSVVVYAAIVITSNTVDVTPQEPPTLTLTTSSTTPYVGDNITLTASFSSALPDVAVTFQLTNSTVLGVALTNSLGVAVLNYTIISLDTLTIRAIAEVTSS